MNWVTIKPVIGWNCLFLFSASKTIPFFFLCQLKSRVVDYILWYIRLYFVFANVLLYESSNGRVHWYVPVMSCFPLQYSHGRKAVEVYPRIILHSSTVKPLISSHPKNSARRGLNSLHTKDQSGPTTHSASVLKTACAVRAFKNLQHIGHMVCTKKLVIAPFHYLLSVQVYP